MDLGCGTGDSVDLFRSVEPAVEWVGVDIEDSPEVAERTIRIAGVGPCGPIRYGKAKVDQSGTTSTITFLNAGVLERGSTSRGTSVFASG